MVERFALACCLFAVPLMSTAQDAPPAEPYASVPVDPQVTAEPAAAASAEPRSRLVEEIVVTAQKREENLQDVPISIQAFSADALDVQGVLDIQDLPTLTPGLVITTQVAYVSTYIRGVGSDAFLLADPSVAAYYDGIYQPFPNGLVQDFGAIERVEILKGPQGTLFGRNAVGGAVNIVTRAPDLKEWRGSLQTGFESDDGTKNRLYVSVPLVEDHLALGFSGVYNEKDNHIDGTAAGKPLDRIRAKGGRVQLRWAPAEWVDLQLTALDINNTGPGTSYTPNVAPSAVLGATIEPQDPYAGAVSEDLFYNHDNELYYGQISLFLPRFDIKLLGSDQKVNSFFNYDFDSSPQPLALFQIDNVFGDIQTAELQIVSNEDSWFADRMQWIVGGYFFESRTGFDPSFLRAASTNLAQGLLLGTQLPPDLVALVSGVIGDTPIPSGDINFVGLLGTQSLAAFAQVTFTITDWMALTLGGRYQNEERSLIQSSSELRNADGSLTPIQSYRDGAPPMGVPVGAAVPPLNDTTETFDPKITLDFRPGWSWLGSEPLVYATWQTATKSSTYNTVNIYDPPDLVEPEDITAYEVGLKTTLLDGLMRFNVAAFNYEIENQQVQFISLLAGGAVTFENAGSVEVQGFEFDALVQVFPSLVDDLILTVGAAFIDPKYASYPDGSGFDDSGLLTQNNDFSGNQVVRSAKESGSIGLSKTFGTAWGPIEIGGNWYHSSRYYYSAQNSPAAEEDPYDLLSARISFLYERWNLRTTVFGENIGDEEYSYSKFPTDFGVGDARAPKSVYGLRLGLSF